MKAYVLIETAAGKTKNVKKALLKVKGGRATVSAMDAVTGARGPGWARLSQLVGVADDPNHGESGAVR